MSTISNQDIPFFSICIPAYKNVQYLKRLLDSIAIQTFTDFEVVVTDDSPDEEVRQLCCYYESKFEINFFKNLINLNTPENWNEAIRKAKGKWIKLIHDDDWLSNESSLQTFANTVKDNLRCNFFFSAYTNVYEGTERTQPMHLKPFWGRRLKQDPNILIADNVIGPPSVTLHKNDKEIWYDRSMKYIVDIDFYIRFLKKRTFCYIPVSLINVGINSAQVTKYTFGVAEVHLKEAFQLLEKTGEEPLKDVIVFDGWWRLIRNFKITATEQIRSTGFEGNVPQVFSGIIKFQKAIPSQILRKGIASKILMIVCYTFLRSRKTIS